MKKEMMKEVKKVMTKKIGYHCKKKTKEDHGCKTEKKNLKKQEN